MADANAVTVSVLKDGPNRIVLAAQITHLVSLRMAKSVMEKVNVFVANVYAIQTQAILVYNAKTAQHVHYHAKRIETAFNAKHSVQANASWPKTVMNATVI